MDLVAIVSSLLCLIGATLVTTAFVLDLKAQEKRYLLFTCILTISLSGLSVLLSFLALCLKRWKLILQMCHVTCCFSVGINTCSEVTMQIHMITEDNHIFNYLLITGSILHFLCSFLIILSLHCHFRKLEVTSKYKNYTGLSRDASESYQTLVQERQSFASGSNVYESVTINPPRRQAVYGSTVGFETFEEEDIYINGSVQ